MALSQRDVLEKLCKWRSVFASWQLGTRLNTDDECNALKDHREVTILLRAEVNALTKVLLDKGIVTEDEWNNAVTEEAVYLDTRYEQKFPGFSTSLTGVDMDVARVRETMKRMNWKP